MPVARVRALSPGRAEAGSAIGPDVVVAEDAVVGACGFGLVLGPPNRAPMPQAGGVRIEDGVEIGANRIDRGTFDDTVVKRGAKIDHPGHIGHDGVIGVDAVISGCTGIAGSSPAGARFMIGPGVGIGDHVTIVDDVVITAAGQVPRHIDIEGVYSSTFRASPCPASPAGSVSRA